MLRVEIYHKTGALPTFRQIKERFNGNTPEIKINDHHVMEGNPYLGEKEVRIYIAVKKLNEADQEGMIILRDSSPEFKKIHPPTPLDKNGGNFLYITEFSINRPTLIEDIFNLVTSFDE